MPRLYRPGNEGFAQRMILVDVGDGYSAFAPAKLLVTLPDPPLHRLKYGSTSA